jgi:primosomal protein N' (replication factor Y) (superfamily II helicase)
MTTVTFADVVLPLPLQEKFTYAIPADLVSVLQPGMRVLVQFGKHKIYSALVWAIHTNAPVAYEAKPILSLVDDHLVVNEKQRRHWEWISEYYFCTLGEVMTAALPAALKLQSESRFMRNPAFDGDMEKLNDKEYLIAEALETQTVITAQEASAILEQKTVLPLLNSLIKKGVLIIHEELREKFKPLQKHFISLSDEYKDEKSLQEIFDKLERKAPRQLETLMAFMKIYFEKGKPDYIEKNELLKPGKTSEAALKELIKKKILISEQRQVGRFSGIENEAHAPIELNEIQQKALFQIKEQFNDKSVVLLHGVTSSGKTEIYIHLIEEFIRQEKQVLYLLPEIALTTQIINRLRKHFGNKVGVYHSRFSDNERVEIWNGLNPETVGELNKFQIILGARSALFLPFNDLGLVIIDEEHENSFKQFEPSPRYHARDAAIVLASVHKAKTLLGSATPSLESFYNAKNGKYGLTNILQRFGGIKMPEIITADIRDVAVKDKTRTHFSNLLIKEIGGALEKGEQVILFQNRRGFAPRLECIICGWSPRCINCDVTLTYHKKLNTCRCHYCGYSETVVQICRACGGTDLRTMGFGTEKVEEELALFFPDAVISRLDLDTTRSKYGFQQILYDFEERKTDILVGTQMITKGLDFDHVSTVGILNADNMLQFPDFRAHERSFQLMAQVSGRAGRKNKQGKVIIQTFNPKHYIIRSVRENNFENVYNTEMAERKQYNYPPYTRLIEFTLKHKDYLFLDRVALEFASRLSVHYGKRVIGPERPVISRIKNLYLNKILLKLEKGFDINESRKIIRKEITDMKTDKDYRQVQIIANADPV